MLGSAHQERLAADRHIARVGFERRHHKGCVQWIVERLAHVGQCLGVHILMEQCEAEKIQRFIRVRDCCEPGAHTLQHGGNVVAYRRRRRQVQIPTIAMGDMH